MTLSCTAEGSADWQQSALRECPGCGLFQLVPALAAGITAQCRRCGTTLHRARQHPLDHSMALVLAALVLMVVMCTTTLMTVRTFGIVHHAGLFAGPAELVRRGMSALAVVVVFVTVAAPLIKLGGTLYVLLRIREARPPRHVRRVFAWVEWLSPWSMIEVFVLGVFVAYVKLGDLVTIELNAGVYALLALTVVLTWADSALDREAVWDALGRTGDHHASHSFTTPAQAEGQGDRPLPAGRVSADAVGCEICRLVSTPREHGANCPRCDSALHVRKPNSIAWTWALVIAAAAMYLPANIYPVLTVVQLGAGQPSTILGGVRELISSGMYPLAALVFFASIAVPMLKLVGLSIMLVATQKGRSGWLRDRTRLYHIVRRIGRWSMIDIFMEALLGALVQFGSVITIEPGVGAVAFCAVVILTMFAAETFDPRLMWDAAPASAQQMPGPAAEAYQGH
jgi:paraquat-inducible protein A